MSLISTSTHIQNYSCDYNFQADVAYKLSLVESFAFGSLISAVDPVATLAIFQALDVDPVLNMLVFGESILNDVISRLNFFFKYAKIYILLSL